MPLYEYQCPQCGRFERIQKFSDAPLTECPTCGQEVQKLLAAPAIQFKGSGWYITDYARKGNSRGKGEAAEGSKADSSKKDVSSPTSSTSKDSAASGSSSTK